MAAVTRPLTVCETVFATPISVPHLAVKLAVKIPRSAAMMGSVRQPAVVATTMTARRVFATAVHAEMQQRAKQLRSVWAHAYASTVYVVHHAAKLDVSMEKPVEMTVSAQPPVLVPTTMTATAVFAITVHAAMQQVAKAPKSVWARGCA